MPMRPGRVFESRSPKAMQGAAVGSVFKASVTGPHRRSRPLPPAISGHAVPRRGRITSFYACLARGYPRATLQETPAPFGRSPQGCEVTGNLPTAIELITCSNRAHANASDLNAVRGCNLDSRAACSQSC